jgi:hypothetical protein
MWTQPVCAPSSCAKTTWLNFTQIQNDLTGHLAAYTYCSETRNPYTNLTKNSTF